MLLTRSWIALLIAASGPDIITGHGQANPRLIACHRPAGCSQAPSTPDAQPRLLRLRGGDGSSLLGNVKASYMGIPPLTRSWLTSIIAFSGLTHVGVLNAEALGLDAASTVNRLQLWRPMTAASFFGGLNAQLLSKMYYLVSFGTQLESLLGIGEFARTLVSVAATLSLIFHFLGWPYTGDGIVMALTVLTCQQNPNQPFSFYGLKFDYQFLPVAQLVLSYLFTQQIPWPDIVGLFVGYFHYYINDELKPDAALAEKLSPPKQAGSTGRTLGGSGGDNKKRKSRIVTMSESKSADACGPSG